MTLEKASELVTTLAEISPHDSLILLEHFVEHFHLGGDSFMMFLQMCKIRFEDLISLLPDNLPDEFPEEQEEPDDTHYQ